MKIRLLVCVAVFLAAARLCSAELPQPFSAGLTISSTDARASGKLFYSDGKTVIKISNPKCWPAEYYRQHRDECSLDRVLSISVYFYEDRPVSRQRSERVFWWDIASDWHPYNPENPCEKSQSECQQLAVEDVDGHASAKWRIKKPDASVLMVWIDKATGVTMKIRNQSGDVMELSKVRSKKQPAWLWSPPRPQSGGTTDTCVEGCGGYWIRQNDPGTHHVPSGSGQNSVQH